MLCKCDLTKMYHPCYTHTYMKKIIIFSILLVVVVAAFIGYRLFLFQPVVMEEMTAEDFVVEAGDPFFIPTFTETDIDFTHQYVEDAGSFAGGTIIDVNGDGVDEIFVGGGRGQESGLFYFEDGAFVNRIDDTGLSSDQATYGSISLDVDTDGHTDLVITREDGVYLFTNNGTDGFSGRKLAIDFEADAKPVAVTAADINHDGLVDFYISTFIRAALFGSATYNDPANSRTNVLVVGQADGTYKDITDQSGTTLRQNTFLSTFVDLDNDGWQDLVVTPNTDEVYIYKNNQDETFTRVSTPSLYGFWMGLAVADVDNDGDQDLFFSNAGNTISERLTRGDLRSDQVHTHEWMYLQNEGDFTFTDQTEERRLAGFEFAWGATFEDFNLDGRQDLVVTENYIKWSAHKVNKLPGRFFVQAQDGGFDPVTTAAGTENFHFGQTPLVADFNRDGYPDLVYVNLEGPLRVLLNDGGDNNYLSVVLPDTVASLGARVAVTAGDKTLTREVLTGVGLHSDQSNELFFGVGSATRADVTVTYTDGSVERMDDVATNTTLEF